MSFSSLKKQSNSSFETLAKEIEKIANPEGIGPDDRIFRPILDKSGNGYVVMRFLPAPEGEELPWAKVWSHGFQGPTGGWLIDNCPTTIGKPCSICDRNNTLWNSGIESDKDIARKQKRKLSYYSNVYIINDASNPENNGKIFIFKYGKKIFDKVMEAMRPAFADEQPINPFDFWKGADFKLKIVKKDGYWNYDKSEFATPSVFRPDSSANTEELNDLALEQIWKQQYSLKEFTDPSKFKSYEALQDRLETVLGLKNNTSKKADHETYEDEEDWARPTATSVVNPYQNYQPQKSSVQTEDEDVLDYFSRLATEA